MNIMEINWMKSEMIKKMSNLEMVGCSVVFTNMVNEYYGCDYYNWSNLPTSYSDGRLWLHDELMVNDGEKVNSIFMVNNEDIYLSTVDELDNFRYYRINEVCSYLWQ